MSQAPVIEVLATGDEVVNGDVLDSNGAYVSRLLVDKGFLISRHGALPDDRTLLQKGLREISERADLCICSGGLGPTEDDLTAEVVAEVSGQPLELHEEALAQMKERAASMGMRFSPNNARSARVPQGSEVFINGVGSAPAFSLTLGRCRFFFLPGVPKEFRYFVDRQILPWAVSNLKGSQGAVKQLKTLGWAESHLAEKFDDFASLFPKVKVGYRVHPPEVWLKLTAEADTREKALVLIAPAEIEVRKRVGFSIFGEGEDELPVIVHKLLEESKLRFAAAESCTGGLMSSLLTANPGSSSYFIGGVVSYSNETKQKLLGVQADTLLAHGAVSRECVLEMARGAIQALDADVAVVITGIAGPGGGSSAKPVGLVYLCLARKLSGTIEVEVIERKFRGDRLRVQRAAAFTALEMVRRTLLGLERLKDGTG